MMQADQESGQGLVEYALIMILVVMLMVMLLAIFGGQVGRMFSTIVLSV